jgi:hypothetical protein
MVWGFSICAALEEAAFEMVSDFSLSRRPGKPMRRARAATADLDKFMRLPISEQVRPEAQYRSSSAFVFSFQGLDGWCEIFEQGS